MSSPIEDLVDSVAARLALGPAAGPIVKGLLGLFFSGPNGLKDILDKFSASGLGPLAQSWIGGTNNAPLAPQGAEQAFGAETIGKLAGKVGVDPGIVTAALAFLAPKLIGLLTQGGAIPTAAPPAVAAFLGSAPGPAAAAAATRPVAAEAAPAAAAQPGGLRRWLPLALAALVALALLAHFWRSPEPKPVAPPPAASVAPAPTAPLAPSRLALSNTNGAISFAGIVGDEASRTGILDAIKKAFGDHASGAIGLAQNVAPVLWLGNLPAVLEQLKTAGTKIILQGSEVNLGGTLATIDSERIFGSLKTLLGGAYAFRQLPPETAPRAAGVDLSSLKDNFTGADLVAALNHLVLNFETGSAVIDASGRAILLQAATLVKKLPPGTIVGIAGYTDSTGDPAANVVLSQHRAEAVRDILVGAGCDPAHLTAKGYGSATATSDTTSRADRRIEFSVSR